MKIKSIYSLAPFLVATSCYKWDETYSGFRHDELPQRPTEATHIQFDNRKVREFSFFCFDISKFLATFF